MEYSNAPNWMQGISSRMCSKGWGRGSS
ncbi:hypothetical protein NC651_037164 [Populus alba x Populus x berolinensis]|nr:hypothetical protein NC651_037164 [Populus alba x Populus x berolinensis]